MCVPIFCTHPRYGPCISVCLGSWADKRQKLNCCRCGYTTYSQLCLSSERLSHAHVSTMSLTGWPWLCLRRTSTRQWPLFCRSKPPRGVPPLLCPDTDLGATVTCWVVVQTSDRVSVAVPHLFSLMYLSCMSMHGNIKETNI